MNENTKTISFVLVAIAVVTLAVVLRHEERFEQAPEDVGQKLFPAFDDPLKPTALEVVKYDENLGKINRFKVAKVGGVWSIPSHEGYPADAKQQVAKAATSIIDLEILGIASERVGDHQEYGVIEPDETKLKPGQEGVGTLVAMQEGDKDLARLIIGKEEPGQDGIRFVRRSGQDRVYRVAVSTESLSTDFSDWIETDLLQLNSFDLNRLVLNDYSVEQGINNKGQIVTQVPHDSTITLALDPKSKQWTIEELIEYKENEPVKATLAENEQLNSGRLSELRSALDSLKIVDVERKPKGMSGSLKGDQDFLNDQQALASLAERGFVFGRAEGGEPRLYSSDGELIAGTKDGVQYILRFGQIAGVTESDDDDKKASETDADKTDADEDESSVNRYLFVMAEFNEELIAKPELKELPTEEKPAGDGKPAEGETEPAEGEAKPAGEEQGEESEGDQTDSDEQQADEDEQEEDEPEAPADEKPGETEADEAAENKATESADPEADEKSAGAEKPNPDNKVQPEVSIESQRKAVEAENKRKQKEYDDKVAAGKKKVEMLNARFADWYYVIPDSVYRKIHLSRSDIIEQKPVDKPAGEETNPAHEGAALPGLPGDQ